MALSGTLKDFGIADILQLIGQQQKTGLLLLKSREGQVTVAFKDGNIVKAQTTSRDKKDLIGSMLVNAGLITDAQLQFALDTQKRTLQRLGDVLVSTGATTAEQFRELVALQTTETLYRLFQWKTGSYSFDLAEVEVDPAFPPLRAESVLMEGFRRVDEWPVVTKRISSLNMTFEKLKELPPEELGKDDFDSALDDAFADEPKAENKGEFQSIGQNERRVYALVSPGRKVEDIIHKSCLGEFETCKALVNLLNLEYLRAHEVRGRPVHELGGDSQLSRLVGVLGRVAVSMVVVGVLLFVGTRMELGAMRLSTANATTYTDPAVQRFASRQQLKRIESALAVFQLEKGALPIALTELVEAGLLEKDDLRYPWADDYFYRRAEDGSYVLLPPLR